VSRDIVLLLFLAACSTPAAPPGEPGAAPLAAAAPRAAVASVVVLELQESCACTQERQRASRAAFDATIAARPAKVPLTVIHMDVEPEKARVYQDLREPVVSPAYYLLDASGLLVALLQGEITGEQFASALGAS